MRTALAVAPKPVLDPAGRSGYYVIIAMAPAPEDIVFEAGSVGSIASWWRR